jgi:lipopolysaccharide/colanic/teichoic acid biosynthesis glycosyltransferase
MSGRDSIDFVDTYSAAYRRGVFFDNGGFDALFPTASVEDQELSFRLARKGYRLVFVPGAAVYHRHDTTLREYWRRKSGIGYWKALLLRWHPERAVQDSHTPQLLKVQIGLAGLLGLFSLLMPFWAPAGWPALSAAVLFALTAIPFVLRVIRKDPPVAVVAPFLLLVRASALGAGLVAGFARFWRGASPRRPPISGPNRVVKRAVDVVGSLAGLVLAAPLCGILAVAIKADSPGPVFFSQERAGENGRPFRMFKLRTMVDGAENVLDQLVDLESLPSPAFKLRDDPRVTRVGRFLRRTSLDELPQLWNVLKGEMSLVGPRPEEVRVVRLYNDWYRQRLAVKPGLTGPMQVNGRGHLTLDERVQYELDYIRNYSLWRDIRILVRTVAVVLSGRGAC